MDEDNIDVTQNDNRLLEAVENGDDKQVKYMVEMIKLQKGMNADLHENCCFLAIKKGFIPILKLVFDKKLLGNTHKGISEFENSVFMSRVLDRESVEGVDFLLSQGLKLFTIDSYPWSAFIHCVRHDKNDILRYIMTLPQMQFPKYQLCFAAMTRDVSVLKKSLEFPEILSEIDKTYDMGGNAFPPICLCFYVSQTSQKTNQEFNCAKLLIDAGADIKSCTVLITLASEYQDVDSVMYLLDQRVGVDTYNLTETLINVCRIVDRDVSLILNCIQRLIESGADPHLPNEEGDTPLSASIGKKREVFDYILDSNLDKRYIDVRCGSMKIPILTSVIISYSNDLELIKNILKSGCDVNLCDDESNTPLMHASAKLCLDLVKLLLDYGANVNACNNEGKNAGNFCLEFDDDSCNNKGYKTGSFCIESYDNSETDHSNQKICVLKLLMDHGMTLDNEYNLLLSAFEPFDLKCVQFLLETDIEKDVIGCLEQNILHLAADTRLPYHVYLMFLRKVKDINQKSKTGYTPINMAADDNNINLVQLLLDHGCDVNSMADNGVSALLMIVRRDNVGLTRAILKAGARPEELLKDRILWLGLDDSLALVLEYGGDVLLDIPDVNGNYIIARSLNDCMYEGSEWTMYNILTYNPSLNNLSLKGKGPALIFTDADYFDILDLLYQSGAPKSELIKNSSEEVVELVEQRIGDYTLMSRCRRILRQALGLGIKEKIKKLSLPEPLKDFLLLKDLIHESYFKLD